MTTIDRHLVAGLRDQLAVRRERLRTGERRLGWKAGFNAPAAREHLGTDRPLVGYLLDTNLVEDGASVPIGGWRTPVLEAEIAVHLARDVRGDATRDDVRAAIGGLSAALELADIDPPPDDVRAVLAGNVFHRHVVLGRVDHERRDTRGITATVTRDGREVAATDDPEASTGEVLEVVRQIAELLAAAHEHLRAGEVIITGTVVPPIGLRPGNEVVADLGPLGRLGLAFTD